MVEEERSAGAGGSGGAGLRRQRRSEAAQRADSGAGEAAASLGDREGDFKKSDGLLREPEPVRFAWIDQQRENFEVSIMCEVLHVSRSGYYAWVDRPQSVRSSRRAELIEQIRQV